jgi:hypothetical protein
MTFTMVRPTLIGMPDLYIADSRLAKVRSGEDESGCP